MNYRIIFESKDKRYRIVERFDQCAELEDLKGDTYNPKAHPEIPLETLRQEEKDFEDLVEREGVFGYILETWNPEPNHGWEHVDSCWGFVGQYSESDPTFKHYIIDEMIDQIPNESK